MDITRFSQNDFDARVWINETFAQQDEQTSLVEKRSLTSSTLARLQVIVRDLNTHLEQDCMNMIRGIPSAIVEIESMNVNAAQTALQVSDLIDKLAALERSERNVTDALQTKHEMKVKLEKIHSTLTDAKQLSTAQKNVRDLFNTKQKYIDRLKESVQMPEEMTDDDLLVKEMVDQLCQVKNTMSTLESYGMSNKQKQELVKYESILVSDYMSPRFCQALVKGHLAKAQREMEWALKIGTDCTQQIFSSYLETRCGSSRFATIDWSTPDSQQVFFDEVFSVMKQEANIYRQIFDQTSIGGQNSFHPLHYLVLYCLEKYYKFTPVIADVANLVNVQYHHASEFAELIIQFLEKENANGKQLESVCKLIFAPFISSQKMYISNIEKGYLTSQIQELSKPLQVTSRDEGYHYELELATQKLFNILHEAADRMLFFTGGVESQAFVRIVNDLIVSFSKQVSALISRVEKSMSQSSEQNWSFNENALRLYETVKDTMGQEIQNFETDLRKKLINDASQLLEYSANSEKSNNEPFEIVNNYILEMSQSDRKRLTEVTNFLRSIDGNMPIISRATKSFTETLESAKLLVHKSLFHQISIALRRFTVRLEKAEIDSDDSDDEQEEKISLQSLEASEYITTIGNHLIHLVSQLEVLSSDDEIRYWQDRICKEAIETLQKRFSQFLTDLLNRKPQRLPSEPRKNKQTSEPGILTPYGMKQIVCDYTAFRGVLSTLLHQPAEEQNEFIEILTRVFTMDSFKEQQNELAHIPVKHSSVIVNTLRELLKRAHDYGYLK